MSHDYATKQDEEAKRRYGESTPRPRRPYSFLYHFSEHVFQALIGAMFATFFLLVPFVTVVLILFAHRAPDFSGSYPWFIIFFFWYFLWTGYKQNKER